jgi:hypothetical protein
VIPRYAIYGLCALLAILAGLSGVDSCRRAQGSAAEVQSAIHQGEATTHAQTAESLPNHTAELASAKADSARAWAEVRRLRKAVDAASSVVPDPVVPPQAGGEGAVDLRTQQLLAADRELIEAQDRQIKGLELALADEQARSEQFRLAYEAERKATAAQAVATKAWKDAVTTSRWKGRVEGFAAGFAAGVASGFVGGRW